MTRVLLQVSLVAGILILGTLYGCEQRARGRAEAEGARWKQELDSLAVVKRGIDTVYRADTVRLWRTLARYDTARVTDTLVRNDTVFVPRAVADEVVAACKLTVLTCEDRVTVRDQQLVAWQRRWDTREKPPSAFRQWSERIASGLVGYGLGKLAP